MYVSESIILLLLLDSILLASDIERIIGER